MRWQRHPGVCVWCPPQAHRPLTSPHIPSCLTQASSRQSPNPSGCAVAPHGDASARLTVDDLAPVTHTPPEVAGLRVVLERFGLLGQRLALQQEPEEGLGAVGH